MDFVKKILHQISRKSEAVSQITFDEDYNVPDARPDVGRMIQKKGEVTIGDVQISEGKARVFGGLTFHLLYVSDGERRRICQLSGELPIDETIHLDGLTGGDKVCIRMPISSPAKSTSREPFSALYSIWISTGSSMALNTPLKNSSAVALIWAISSSVL